MHLLFLPVFIFCICLPSSPVYAFQDSMHFTIQHYTDMNGLPQNSVKAIVKDREGFIWFSTEDGLVRFDGKHFINFAKENPGLTSYRFHTILQNRRDSSFVAANASAECLRIYNGTALKDSLFLEERKNILTTIPWLYLPDYAGYGRSGEPDEINGLIHTGKDSVVLAGNSWLYAVLPGHIETYADKKQQAVINCKISSADRLFIFDDTLYYWDPSNRIHTFTGDGKHLETFLTGNISEEEAKRIKLYRSNFLESGVLVCTGERWYNLQKEGGKFVARMLITNFSWKTNNIMGALYDPETNRLFLGSTTDGLFVFAFSPFTVIKTGRNDLDNVFYSQTFYAPESVLTAQGHIININTRSIEKTALSRFINTDKYSIVTDAAGFIWTKESKTLVRVDPRTLKELQHWQRGSYVTTLYAADSILYTGTYDGKILSTGIYGKELTPQLFFQLPATITYLQALHGNIWAGTEKGLYQISRINTGWDTVVSIPRLHVRSLYVSGENQVWGTSYENGIFLLQGKKITCFPVDRQQILRNAHCIVDDHQGSFWITTNKGLFQASKNDLLAFAAGMQQSVFYHYYSTDEGLITNEFNGGCQPCGLLLYNGWISLPSMKGMIWFNPADMNQQNSYESIFIDRILVSGKQVAITDTIGVSRLDQQIKISLSAPQWKGKNIYWEYALPGNGDTSWFDADNDMISLSTMSSGTHVLLIRKANGFGTDNYSYRKLVIIVPYGWYLHPVSLLCGGFLGLLLVWGGVRLRIGYIKRQNKHLEQKVGEKTRELQVINRQLEASRSALDRRTQLQEKIIASVSHDVKSPMAYLKMITDRIYEGLKQEGNSAYLRPMQVVNTHTEKLYYFMDNLLNYVKIQTATGDILMEEFSVKELAAEKIDFFREMAEQKQTCFIDNTSPHHFVACNRVLLSIIIHNLLDNSQKACANGNVVIGSGETGEEILLTVKDTGTGFPPHILQWLNEEQLEKPYDDSSHGLGLYIVKDLMRMLKIRSTSVNNNGATITLFLKKAHVS
ncbi:MAG: hypothetical protein KF746_14670 [Chitinophagaceae bacterium]|nr:hypothetical protein [Chitinophagaceae bacterium]